ncbi:MAG TPA: Kazal-type serine protease inhibitor domain-containing protein [Polyangiaceae bacterium]|nr:Kazal-type serine protease inhibitor domain-containing protein [Polyangiaceae bacterium]
MTPPGTNGPCESDEHCPSGQYCSGAGCGKPGGCAWPKSSVDCSGEASEVCGCDGKTYTNACWAAAAATRVAANGRCR